MYVIKNYCLSESGLDVLSLTTAAYLRKYRAVSDPEKKGLTVSFDQILNVLYSKCLDFKTLGESRRNNSITDYIWTIYYTNLKVCLFDMHLAFFRCMVIHLQGYRVQILWVFFCVRSFNCAIIVSDSLFDNDDHRIVSLQETCPNAAWSRRIVPIRRRTLTKKVSINILIKFLS